MLSLPTIFTVRKTQLVEPGSRKEKRSYPDDYTLFRISAFGGYYGIANKLVYFNCSGMYVFPVPTYPCLFLAHQKSCRFFFPLNTKSMKKIYFLDIKENEVKMTKHRKLNRNLNIGLFYAI